MKIVAMMKSLLFLLSVSISLGFNPFSFRQGSRTSVIVLHKTKVKKQPNSGTSVDWERAKDCAEHFGMCDVAEVKDLFAGVHKERIQHQLFGGVDLQHDSVADIEHKIIEEELELQLNLLQSEERRLAEEELEIFPEEMTSSLPHLHEHADAQHKEPIASRILHKAEHELAVQETVMGEDTLETLAMCAAVVALVLLPQFVGN